MEPWQTITMTVINILAIIASPIIALLISNKIEHNKDKKNEKYEIFKILMKQRQSYKDIEYVNALNLIDVVFIDNNNIRKAYKNLYNEYHQKAENVDFEKVTRLETKLIEEIRNDLGYKDKITWDEIQEPYIPQWIVNQKVAQQNYYNLINSANSMIQTRQQAEEQISTTTKIKKDKK